MRRGSTTNNHESGEKRSILAAPRTSRTQKNMSGRTCPQLRHRVCRSLFGSAKCPPQGTRSGLESKLDGCIRVCSGSVRAKSGRQKTMAAVQWCFYPVTDQPGAVYLLAVERTACLKQHSSNIASHKLYSFPTWSTQ